MAPLSPQEEKQCFAQMKNGDEYAKEALILHNMRLVAHVAKKYSASEEDVEDLISIGTIGLLKAVSTFDSDYGSRFATYAIRCIENEMLMHFRNRKKFKGEVSLYEPIGTDKEGNQIHLFDVLEQSSEDVTEQLARKEQMKCLMEHMKQVLDEREYEIIVKRFGLFGQEESTQREIARNLNISRSYVSRIEKKALFKLKKLLQT